jgi:hypothetical protein
MLIVTWSQLRRYFYDRRNNKVAEDYYTSKLRFIEEYFKDKDFSQDGVDCFLEWKKKEYYSRTGKPFKNSTYNKYLCLLRVIARKYYGFSLENINRNEDEDRIDTEHLTVDEIDKILATERQYKKTPEVVQYMNFRFKTIFLVHIITTQRPSAIAHVKVNDYDLGKQYLRFKAIFQKNKQEVVIKIPDTLHNMIVKLRKYSQHDYLFGNEKGKMDREWINNEVKIRAKLVGIEKKITGMSLRGTGITMYLKKYALHQVAKVSNHKNINVLAKHYYDPARSEIDVITDTNDIIPSNVTNEQGFIMIRQVCDTLRKTNLKDKVDLIEEYVKNIFYP